MWQRPNETRFPRRLPIQTALGQSNGPVRVNVHVDLGGGPPAPMGILNPCLLNNLQPALQDSSLARFFGKELGGNVTSEMIHWEMHLRAIEVWIIYIYIILYIIYYIYTYVNITYYINIHIIDIVYTYYTYYYTDGGWTFAKAVAVPGITWPRGLSRLGFGSHHGLVNGEKRVTMVDIL